MAPNTPSNTRNQKVSDYTRSYQRFRVYLQIKLNFHLQEKQGFLCITHGAMVYTIPHTRSDPKKWLDFRSLKENRKTISCKKYPTTSLG